MSGYELFPADSVLIEFDTYVLRLGVLTYLWAGHDEQAKVRYRLMLCRSKASTGASVLVARFCSVAQRSFYFLPRDADWSAGRK